METNSAQQITTFEQAISRWKALADHCRRKQHHMLLHALGLWLLSCVVAWYGLVFWTVVFWTLAIAYVHLASSYYDIASAYDHFNTEHSMDYRRQLKTVRAMLKDGL